MGVEVQKGKADDGPARRAFMKRLLRDVRALEQMLLDGKIESGIRRIGAEQELFLIDAAHRPAPMATEVLAHIDDPLIEHELGLYNIEFSVHPVLFGTDCLSQMEREVTAKLNAVRVAAKKIDLEPILTGILPTIEKGDLGLHNQTPNPRYRLLNDTLADLRGDAWEIHIRGADEISIKHDDVMLESANTSFQIHFQVGPNEFSRLYNIAQAVCAPVLASAVNSPLLFGKRLWHETRIALFEQSVDTRQSAHHLRELKSRVSFGTQWVEDSVLDVFREDIARFRVLFAASLEDGDPFEALHDGRAPELAALCLYNSTVYRWNRPCYGVGEDGAAHLRIENRVLPSGPTVLDEMANSAFWFGLMSGVIEEFGDITTHMDFDEARGNFVAAAREGLAAPITWTDGQTYSAHDLIADRLLPLAREGLEEGGIDTGDIDRYLEVIERRVSTKTTGAMWLLRSYTNLKAGKTKAETLSALCAATLRHQTTGLPVHEWPVVGAEETTSWRDNHLRVSQYMSRDLFTVNSDDPVDLAASLMTWHHIHWIPVEDHAQHLVGLVTHDLLLKLYADPTRGPTEETEKVSSIMATDIASIGPQTLTRDAIAMMYEHGLSCLPVVEHDKLVGMVTERDVMSMARELLEERLGERSPRIDEDDSEES